MCLHFTVFILHSFSKFCLHGSIFPIVTLHVYVAPSSDYTYLYFQNFSPCKISQSLIYISLYFTILSLHACTYLHFTIVVLLCLYFPYRQSKCVRVLLHLHSTMHILYKSAFLSLQSICVCICLNFPDLPVCICLSSLHSSMHIFPILRSMCLHFAVFSLYVFLFVWIFQSCLYVFGFSSFQSTTLVFTTPHFMCLYFQNLKSKCTCFPITVYICLYFPVFSLCVEVSQSCLYMSG